MDQDQAGSGAAAGIGAAGPWGRPTAILVAEAQAAVRALGLEPGEAEERWEGDGVWIVGPPGDPEGNGWYLEITGTDNDLYPPAIGLEITGGEEEEETAYNLGDLRELEVHLRAAGRIA